jgi:hypothetical protein
VKVKAAAIKVHALLMHLCTQQQDSDQDSDQDMTQVGQDGGGGFDQWTADQCGKCAASIPPRDGRIAQWTKHSLALRLHASEALSGRKGKKGKKGRNRPEGEKSGRLITLECPPHSNAEQTKSTCG